jgi:hypothetical protein
MARICGLQFHCILWSLMTGAQVVFPNRREPKIGSLWSIDPTRFTEYQGLRLRGEFA